MTIVTAQLVRGPDGKLGVNTLVYGSGNGVPRHADGTIDLPAALTHRGSVERWDFELPPGRNAVVAFFDLVVDGEAGSDDLDWLVMNLSKQAQVEKLPIEIATNRAAVRMNAEPQLADQGAQLLAMLASRTREVLQKGPGFLPAAIQVLAELRDTGEVTYSLSPSSRRRIARLAPSAATLPFLTVGTNTASDFGLFVGSVPLSVAQLLSGLSEGELLQLGGVSIVSAADRQEVFRWPRLTPAITPQVSELVRPDGPSTFLVPGHDIDDAAFRREVEELVDPEELEELRRRPLRKEWWTRKENVAFSPTTFGELWEKASQDTPGAVAVTVL